MNRTLLTQDGYQKLTIELDGLNKKRDHLVSQIEEVAQPDESSEDGLATQLKDELEVVYDKITKIEEALETAQIINSKSAATGKVTIGSVVKIKISNNSTKEFNIVSHMESDPTQNKISDQSPLGLALLGKMVNDEIEVEAPMGKITYKIVSIA